MPINSIEKYLLNVLILQVDLTIKKNINDSMFSIDSIDVIIRRYLDSEDELKRKLDKRYKADTDGKQFYQILLKDLTKRNVSEIEFINVVYSIIKQNVNFDNFKNQLSKALNQDEQWRPPYINRLNDILY